MNALRVYKGGDPARFRKYQADRFRPVEVINFIPH